jgi:hypothetical protein
VLPVAGRVEEEGKQGRPQATQGPRSAPVSRSSCFHPVLTHGVIAVAWVLGWPGVRPGPRAGGQDGDRGQRRGVHEDRLLLSGAAVEVSLVG